MKRLQNRVAIVTGSSSGIGRAITLAFATEGAKIVCSDIRRKPKKGGFETDPDVPTDELVRNMNGESIFVKCNVSKLHEVKALIEAAVERFGRLDIMVNNAGVIPGTRKLVHEYTEKELDACYNVNIKGTFFSSQEAVKQFLKQGDSGNIINIVSTAGLQAYAYQSVYNTSKGAVANLTKCLAIEYGRNKIRVNGICPTMTKTSMVRKAYDEVYNMVEDGIPLGRWTEAKDIANLAVFLASDESDFIHGDLIRLDGGETVGRFHPL